MKRKILILLIFIIILSYSFIHSQSTDDPENTGKNFNNGIGRGFENRGRDNIYRDEHYLEGLIAPGSDKEEDEDDKKRRSTITTHYDPYEDVVERTSNFYYKFYDNWDVYKDKGISELNEYEVKEKIKERKNYFVSYHSMETNKILSLKEYIGKIHINTVIYDDTGKVLYKLWFDYNKELEKIMSCIYNSEGLLTQKNYFKGGELNNYINYEYYSNGMIKLEREYNSFGDPEGNWKNYSMEGLLVKEEYYIDGTFKSMITHFYNKTGIETKKVYYNETYELQQYWVRNVSEIEYFDKNHNKISWKTFMYDINNIAFNE